MTPGLGTVIGAWHVVVEIKVFVEEIYEIVVTVLKDGLGGKTVSAKRYCVNLVAGLYGLYQANNTAF